MEGDRRRETEPKEDSPELTRELEKVEELWNAWEQNGAAGIEAVLEKRNEEWWREKVARAGVILD